MRLRLLLALVAAVASSVAPRAAHATAAFKFFTDRAAFLAQFASPTTTQVDLNAIATPGGSALVSTVGGLNVGSIGDVNTATSGAMVIDPTMVGLPGSYGTDNLLSVLLSKRAPVTGNGNLSFDVLPGGVTGFAFDFGALPSANAIGGTLTVGAFAPSLNFQFEDFALPADGSMQFLGIVIDPTALVDPTTSIMSVTASADIAASATELQLLFGNVEYTTSALAAIAAPEPATLALFATGLGAMLVGVRRRRAR